MSKFTKALLKKKLFGKLSKARTLKKGIEQMTGTKKIYQSQTFYGLVLALISTLAPDLLSAVDIAVVEKWIGFTGQVAGIAWAGWGRLRAKTRIG